MHKASKFRFTGKCKKIVILDQRFINIYKLRLAQIMIIIILCTTTKKLTSTTLTINDDGV